MSAINFIKAVATKSLTGNRGSGIRSIPSAIEAEAKAGEILAILQKAGIPINQLDDYIRSEADVAKFLNLIETSSQPRVIPGSSAEGRAITDKLFGKKGDVVDMTGKKMDTSQGIMGGKSVKELMESGQIQKGTDNIKISEKITDRDIFKNADQRLKGPIKRKMDMGEFGKVDVETDYSASINRKEFFDPKAKNMYDKTVKTGPEFFKAQKEQILNTINRKKKEMVPTTHSNYKLLKKSLQDQEDALEAIKVTEDLGGNENMFDFLRTQNIADYKAKPLQRSNYTKTDAEIKAKFDKDNQDSIQRFKDKMKDDPEDMAKGGRAGLYTGGMVDVEPNLSDIGHGSDALMARTRLVSPDGQATTSTGLNYLLAEDNDNIRVPFAGGGGGRRAFLKMLGLTGAGIAGLKSGIIGVGEGGAKKAVTETVKQAAGSGGQVPPYFLNLVSKIKTLGDDTLATKDKAIAKKYKDYTMEEDFAGNIEIIKKGDNVAEDVFMSYKVDEVPLKGKKGSSKVEDYEEYTARPDAEGKMKDIEPGVPDEVVQEGTPFEDDYTDFGKADGGRIGYNIGGLSKLGINSTSRRFLEKIFGKEKFATMIENDPRMHKGMLEVVEMFRNRDKEGLKMYLQKFMPDMGDAEIEKFIVGDSGTEGIEGQLIRLGSGREYKNLINMKKEADQIRKLDDFDIEDVSKNAEGGRIGFSGGGIFRAIIAKSAASKGMSVRDFIKATNYKGLSPEVKMYISAEEFAALKSGQKDLYDNFIDMAKTRKNFQEQIEGGKGTPAKPLFDNLEQTMDEKSFVPKTVTSDDIAQMELMVKNRFNKDRKDNAQGGLQTMLGE